MRNALKPWPYKPSGKFGPFNVIGIIGTQVITDSFTRANQSPIAGNGWTNGTDTGLNTVLNNNRVEPAGFGGADADCFYSSWASGDNQYSQAEITVVGNNAGAHAGLGIVVRRSTTAGTGTYYRAVIDDAGNIFLSRTVATVTTQITSRTVIYSATKKLGLSINGTTLKIWYDGVQQGADASDANIASGAPGLAYSSNITSGFQDNWDAGTTP